MAQRFETDGGTAFVAPLVLIDAEGNVVGEFDPDYIASVDAGLLKSASTAIDASDGGVGETDAVFSVPENAILLGVNVVVDEPFDGDSTATVQVGVAGTANAYVGTSDIDPSDAAGTQFGVSLAELAIGADIDIIATWTNNDNATEGVVTVTVLYRE